MATLARIAKDNGKPMPQGTLTVYKQVSSHVFANHGQLNTLTRDPSMFLNSQTNRGQLKDLFSPQYWKTTLLLWFLWLDSATFVPFSQFNFTCFLSV